MMESTAREIRERFGDKKPIIVAVTVLTSLDKRGLAEVGVERPLEDQVRALALLTEECGIDGVVCSPHEIRLIRSAVKPNFKIVVPGIRMPNQSPNDQQRAATPRDALTAGADYIVVGRAVTDDKNPREALERVLLSV